MKYLYQYALTTIFLALFCEPTSSFWTNSFSGGSTHDVSNTNTGMHSCPKWANYFEVDNTTLDCKEPKLNSRTPFRLRADTFCDKICEEDTGQGVMRVFCVQKMWTWIWDNDIYDLLRFMCIPKMEPVPV